MKLFRKVKMEGQYWAVFLVNPIDASDRKMASSIFDNERDAVDCAADFNRIVGAAATVVETEEAAKVVVTTAERDLGIERSISFEDV